MICFVYISNKSLLELFTDYFECATNVHYKYLNSHSVLLGSYNLSSAHFSNVIFFF